MSHDRLPRTLLVVVVRLASLPRIVSAFWGVPAYRRWFVRRRLLEASAQ